MDHRTRDQERRFREDVAHCVSLICKYGDCGNAYKTKKEDHDTEILIFSNEVVERARLIYKRAIKSTI